MGHEALQNSLPVVGFGFGVYGGVFGPCRRQHIRPFISGPGSEGSNPAVHIGLAGGRDIRRLSYASI